MQGRGGGGGVVQYSGLLPHTRGLGRPIHYYQHGEFTEGAEKMVFY